MIIYNPGTTVHDTNLERPRSDVRISGSPLSVNAEVVLDLNGESSWMATIQGTYTSGLYSFEGTFDGTNYIALPMLSPLTELWNTQPVTAATGNFIGNCAGMKKVRVRVSTAIAGGTPVVTVNASLGVNIIHAVPIPATLSVTNTGAAAAAVTLTLPAPGVGLYHYITRLLIQRFASAVLTPAATPVIVTTTNLPGSRAFSIQADAAAMGVIYTEIVEPSQPLKTSAANTATTIVCPGTTGVIWRVTADYYSAA